MLQHPFFYTKSCDDGDACCKSSGLQNVELGQEALKNAKFELVVRLAAA
jgi:hypothetical protein